MNSFFIIALLGIVEGFTEFLPVSSTGHMIIVEKLIGSDIFSKDFMNNFLIMVQIGPIIAVVIYFWNDLTPFVKTKKEFIKKFRLWVKIIIGVLPAIVIGLLLDDYISEYFLDNVYVVVSALIFYGILLIVIEKHNSKNPNPKAVTTFEKLKYRTAFYIGFFQCLAMIPGTSRSGITIIGGLLLGLSRGIATEFSFYLAIPIMFGATLLKLIKSGFKFSGIEWLYLGLGTFISFVVAYAVIKWFMGYIKSRTFVLFGLYRIILGIIVLIVFLF